MTNVTEGTLPQSILKIKSRSIKAFMIKAGLYSARENEQIRAFIDDHTLLPEMAFIPKYKMPELQDKKFIIFYEGDMIEGVDVPGRSGIQKERIYSVSSYDDFSYFIHMQGTSVPEGWYPNPMG